MMVVPIEKAKIHILVIMKPPTCFANGSNRHGCKRFLADMPEHLGAFVAYLVDRVVHLGRHFEVVRVVEDAPIFKEDQKAPYRVRLGWSWIGPREPTERRADPGYAACCRCGDLLGLPEPSAHRGLLTVLLELNSEPI